MYKGITISLIILILVLPFVYSQEENVDRTIDMIDKIMKTARKDISDEINKNMDDNFKQFDDRMSINNSNLFRKAIISISGILAIVIFGYAYLNNRIMKRYDINFYERMIESKIGSSQIQRAVKQDSLYTSVTKSQFNERYETPDEYFEKVSDGKQVKELKNYIEFLEKKIKKDDKVDKSQKITGKKVSFFDRFRKKEKTGMLSLDKKVKSKNKLLIILIIALIIILVMLFIFRQPISGFIDNLHNNTTIQR